MAHPPAHTAGSFFAPSPPGSRGLSNGGGHAVTSGAESRSGRSAGDLDVFSSLTDSKPGIIPLLVRLPDGNHSQIDVDPNSTVDEISAMLRPGLSGDDLRLSFGNEELPPGASLLDTNIVDAYEHAGSLLHLIGSAGGDPDAKAAALDSACAVVESISSGIKDMEALCAAALDPVLSPPALNSPRTAGLIAEGAAQAARETPKELDGGEFKMLNSMLSRGDKQQQTNVDAPAQKIATPAELAYGLSRRLPMLFPPEAAAAAFADTLEAPEVEDQPDEQPGLGRRASLVIQPSIKAIREARRRARQMQPSIPEEKPASEQAANAITIGGSTNGMPLPPDLPGRGGDVGPPPAQGQTQPVRSGSSVLMAVDAKSTWLEDVMKTWEVGVVRQSGVLEKTKDGQELNQYLDGLEAEAQRDLETAEIEAESRQEPHTGGEGYSEEEGEYEGDTQENARGQEKTGGRKQMDGRKENGTGDLNKSMANFGLSDAAPRAKAPAAQMMQAQFPPSAATSDPLSTKSPDSSRPTQSYTRRQSPATTGLGDSTRASSLSSASSQPTESSSRSTEVRPMGRSQSPPVRQAKKIAPALNIAMGHMGANGMFPSPILPGGAPGAAWPPRQAPPGPKKRGRKRKNPELTEDERALMRKEQNRESAKLSRVRRKVIAAEYEGRLNSLLGENTMLRKSVEGLNNRLVYLQTLLTVSVRQEGDNTNP